MLSELVVSLICFLCVTICQTQRVEILMPNVTTTQEDAYMCTSYKLDDDQSFIVKIEPLTNMKIAHHMFVFGCEKPSTTLNAWNCGSNVCQGEKTILFAWARNAPPLNLPEDVAFRVGPETKHRYLVVNIHYLDRVKSDNSGVGITLSNKPRKYEGGIMIMVTGDITIPPREKVYKTDISCKYKGPSINVFAYRVHAHVHGDVNTAYLIHNHEWTKVAQGDPQWPQAFYPLDKKIEVNEDDILVGRCVYHNNEDRTIYAGPTHKDEMCNIYLMYYTTDADHVQDTCSGNYYPSLESIIPNESYKKPPMPTLVSGSPDDKGNNMHHHDNMDASSMSKLHSQQKPKQQQQNLGNKQQQSYLNMNKSPLIASLFNNLGLLKQQQQQQQDQPLSDDYYDDVERGRSKNRLNDLNIDYNSIYDSLDNDDFDYSSSLGQSGVAFDKPNQFNRLIKSTYNKIPLKSKIAISKYTLINDWYDSKTIKIGQVGGVVVDSNRGNIIVFHRGSQTWESDSFNTDRRFNSRKYPVISEDTIVVLNSISGKLVKSWGSNMFYLPHGITVDPMGNIWVTDVGRHQVIKFAYNDTSKPLLEIGVKGEPGNDKTHFCQPSDVAVLRNGDFYVSDGYCNSRIVKLDKYGNYLMHWSGEEQESIGHFYIPHALALHEGNNLICVADRENYRVQCFDLNGNFMHQSTDKEYGPIYGVSFASNNGSVLYAINGYAANKETQYEKKILLIQVSDGSVIGTVNVDQDLLSTPHDIDVSSDGSEIYIGTLNPPKVVKYAYLSFTNTLKPKQNNTNKVNLRDNIDADKENFRTSMFIMAFLAVPLTIVVIAAIIIRLKNAGKLRNVSNILNESKHSDLSKWIKSTKSNKNNGFTRLNQDSDHENEPLENDSDSDEITVPLSKA